MNKERNSSIELLRIISILMVVISHYSVHNGIDNSMIPLGINRFLLESFSLGNIGVILFVMITGYFMSGNRNGIKINKLLILYMQVLFYSLIVYLIFVLFGYEIFSIKSLIKYMMPFTFNQYWFFTTYIILYLLSPYINKLLDVLSRKDNLKLIGLFLLLFSVLPTLTLRNFYGNELLQFILFYFLGAYFKKYANNIFSKNKKYNYFMFVISLLLLFGSVIIIDLIQVRFDFSIISSTYFFNRNSILAIFFSVSLFNIFVNKKSFCSNKINTISSCVFGIYLLSDHNIVRKFLWIDLLKNKDYVLENEFLLHFLISIIFVCIACFVVEYIRKNTIEKIILKFLKSNLFVSFSIRLKNLFINILKNLKFIKVK